MERYTIGQACAILGIPRSTFARHCRKLKIVAKKIGLDDRKSYISASDLERIQNAYPAQTKRIRTAQHMESELAAHLLQQVALLTDEVTALRDSLDARNRPPDVPESPTLPLDVSDDTLLSPPRKKRTRGVIPLPDGYVSVIAWCKSHGVAETTIRSAIMRGELQEEYYAPGWRVGRTYVQHAFSPDQQAAALRLYGKDH